MSPHLANDAQKSFLHPPFRQHQLTLPIPSRENTRPKHVPTNVTTTVTSYAIFAMHGQHTQIFKLRKRDLIHPTALSSVTSDG
jgi:hypothetical protein